MIHHLIKFLPRTITNQTNLQLIEINKSLIIQFFVLVRVVCGRIVRCVCTFYSL